MYANIIAQLVQMYTLSHSALPYIESLSDRRELEGKRSFF